MSTIKLGKHGRVDALSPQEEALVLWVLGLATAAGGAVDRSLDSDGRLEGGHEGAGRREESVEDSLPPDDPWVRPRWTVLCGRCLMSMSGVRTDEIPGFTE